MFIVTANPETLMIGYENADFHTLLKKPSTIIVPDGIGVVKAANALGIPIKERITGVELVTFLFAEAARLHKKIFFIWRTGKCPSNYGKKTRKRLS